MVTTWEEYCESLCQRLETDFNLPLFKNRAYPITALTSNDRIEKDPEFKKHMKKDQQKDLATLGDAIIHCLIYEHFVREFPLKKSKDLNNQREKFGKNRNLHLISKSHSVNLKNYLMTSDNDPCWENGRTCLAVYFKALVAIIFIDNGLDTTRNFFKTISFFNDVYTA